MNPALPLLSFRALQALARNFSDRAREKDRVKEKAKEKEKKTQQKKKKVMELEGSVKKNGAAAYANKQVLSPLYRVSIVFSSTLSVFPPSCRSTPPPLHHKALLVQTRQIIGGAIVFHADPLRFSNTKRTK